MPLLAAYTFPLLTGQDVGYKALNRQVMLFISSLSEPHSVLTPSMSMKGNINNILPKGQLGRWSIYLQVSDICKTQ
ncbi:hypothetical protein XENTR_v10018636 [Xenopus tropicalis]|nr:hypothetical protein XENTR_v10018636 [Xenopus tropicalis]